MKENSGHMVQYKKVACKESEFTTLTQIYLKAKQAAEKLVGEDDSDALLFFGEKFEFLWARILGKLEEICDEKGVTERRPTDLFPEFTIKEGEFSFTFKNLRVSPEMMGLLKEALIALGLEEWASHTIILTSYGKDHYNEIQIKFKSPEKCLEGISEKSLRRPVRLAMIEAFSKCLSFLCNDQDYEVSLENIYFCRRLLAFIAGDELAQMFAINDGLRFYGKQFTHEEIVQRGPVRELKDLILILTAYIKQEAQCPEWFKVAFDKFLEDKPMKTHVKLAQSEVRGGVRTTNCLTALLQRCTRRAADEEQPPAPAPSPKPIKKTGREINVLTDKTDVINNERRTIRVTVIGTQEIKLIHSITTWRGHQGKRIWELEVDESSDQYGRIVREFQTDVEAYRATLNACQRKLKSLQNPDEKSKSKPSQPREAPSKTWEMVV